ncbi:MAG: roadblock/LC7 domain-containing protein [Promethearchaeota archaeon]
MKLNFHEILMSLKKIKGIHGSAIIERYGGIVESELPGWVNPELMAALATHILKISEKSAYELNQGAFLDAIIENERGKLLFYSMSDKVVSVVTTSDAKLGILDMKLKSALEKMK